MDPNDECQCFDCQVRRGMDDLKERRERGEDIGIDAPLQVLVVNSLPFNVNIDQQLAGTPIGKMMGLPDKIDTCARAFLGTRVWMFDQYPMVVH